MKNSNCLRVVSGACWIALGLLLLSACVAPPASRAQSLASKGQHVEAVEMYTRAMHEAPPPLERVSLLSGRAESKRALGDSEGADVDSEAATALAERIAADVERVVRALDSLSEGVSMFGTNRDTARQAVEEGYMVTLTGPGGRTVVVSPDGSVRVGGQLVSPPE